MVASADGKGTEATPIFIAPYPDSGEQARIQAQNVGHDGIGIVDVSHIDKDIQGLALLAKGTFRALISVHPCRASYTNLDVSIRAFLNNGIVFYSARVYQCGPSGFPDEHSMWCEGSGYNRSHVQAMHDLVCKLECKPQINIFNPAMEL